MLPPREPFNPFLRRLPPSTTAFPKPFTPPPPPSYTVNPEFQKEYDLIIRGTHPTKIRIYNERGLEVNTKEIERVEQAMAEAYIQPDDVVLELGARYGSVSCRINLKLADKTKQVSVEPDSRVWEALEKNRDANQCNFQIVKGCISETPRSMIHEFAANGYAATTIETPTSTVPHFTLEEVKQTCGIERFTVVFADCEGCLGYFFKENPTLWDSLRLFIYEADNPKECDYTALTTRLKEKGFHPVMPGFHSVWSKKPLYAEQQV